MNSRFQVGDVVSKDGVIHEILHIDFNLNVYTTCDFAQFPINEFDKSGILISCSRNSYKSLIKCECGADVTYGESSTSEFHSRWMNCPKSF